jgi:energy-coupling factor transport system substrate-specific component
MINKPDRPVKTTNKSYTVEDKTYASRWSVGLFQILAAILGILLYSLLSHANLVILLPTGTLDVFLPGLLIPLLFGAIFGPWVGFMVGCFGFLIGDYIANMWFQGWYWDNGYLYLGSALINFRDLIGWNGIPGYIANALFGFCAGLALPMPYRRYDSAYYYARAGILSSIGLVIGIALVVFSAVWIYRSPYYTIPEASTAYFDTLLPDLLLALIVLPLLLFIYNALLPHKKSA